MTARSIKGKSTNEILEALRQQTQDGFEPTLAIVFISIKMDRAAIAGILHEKGISVIGATSSGEFIDGHQSEGEAAILLLDIPKEDFTILFRETVGQPLGQVVQQAAREAMTKFSNPAYIAMTTCLNEKGELFEGAQFVHTLEESHDGKTDIFGGMAGADGELIPSWVFTENQTSDEGFVLLVLDRNKIDLFGVAISGWKPLGRIRTVTKCEDGWLCTIDDQPALDMYLRYLGESLDQKEEKANLFVENISMFHPFLCLDDVDPVLRTPMFVDKEKNAISMDYPIPEGGTFQFTLPPDFDIVESVFKEAEIMQKGSGIRADALLVFSCLGRLSALGPMATQENEGLHEIWQAPMAGFFTYGEYGKDLAGKNKMHSTTCSWVALKEKPNPGVH
ncbi:MAG: FIST C-terminal domain-containing protein [Saprospiraceae bacterium]|nr:FIST C-terminal domain-containing protein [Saprospiraceae bacterium]